MFGSFRIPQANAAPESTPADLQELLLRIVELLERLSATSERIESQQARTNELLHSLDRSQWS